MLKLSTAVIGVVASSTLFANPIDQVRPDAPELAKFGKYSIGVQTVSLSNKNQLDVLSIDKGRKSPRYDRPLTLEIWYPTQSNSSERGEYKDVYLRDGKTKVTLTGRAQRDAQPIKTSNAFPLIILSHGYPGNRFLMSHLGENMASKGYVVVSIDHTESTYENKQAFASTLVNRSLDQMFVLNEMERLSKKAGHFLKGLVNADQTGLIGYSMGGYGAVISAGAGVTQKSIDYSWGAPNGSLNVHKAGSQSHSDLIDSRLKAVVTFAPWGKNHDFWDKKGLEGIKIPMMYIAGSDDDISGYENGGKSLFEGSVNTDRYLLTYHFANHNAGAPMPAPKESWEYSAAIGFAPFEHYADPVWDSVRMNNIAQHFSTAFMDIYLKNQKEKTPYLDLTTHSAVGVYSLDEQNKPTKEHSYWLGFPNKSAKGLSLEFKARK
ncbi:MAG: dienelactone hydrolase [Pseudomonadales bacterium]|nr:dienelactone hydrolase [Pseudomonadales bacterium]